MLLAIDHVQLAMPAGSDALAEARAFYAGVLGLVEVPRPPALAARPGLWFVAGPVKVHLGVEEAFRPARKAHPAFVVADLDALLERCRAAGGRVVPAEALDGQARAHVDDPFGNRIELIGRGP
jgi:catechol 2,3-dioxygenase-like lactoylglutathione lyase family enzyme